MISVLKWSIGQGQRWLWLGCSISKRFLRKKSFYYEFRKFVIVIVEFSITITKVQSNVHFLSTILRIWVLSLHLKWKHLLSRITFLQIRNCRKILHWPILYHCTVDYTYFNTSYFRLCRYMMYLKICIKISIVFCEVRCHDAFCLRLS